MSRGAEAEVEVRVFEDDAPIEDGECTIGVPPNCMSLQRGGTCFVSSYFLRKRVELSP